MFRYLSYLGLVMFLGCILRHFIKFGECLAIISSNIFQPLFLSLLILGFSLHICWYVWYCPTGFWGSVHFSSIFWVFCYSNWIISIDLSSSLIPSSIILNLLLGPWDECFYFNYCTFHSGISVWFLFIFKNNTYLLLRFSICWFIIVILSFNALNMVSFSSGL